MARLSIKKLKSIFTIVLTLSLILIFIMGLGVAYRPSSILKISLWLVLYPFSNIILIYFVYYKKNSNINIALMRKRLLEIKKHKWMAKTVGINVVFLLPAIFAFYIETGLALAGEYLANQKTVELVTIEKIQCRKETRRGGHSNLSLHIVAKNNERFKIDFPYNLCKQYPKITKLRGESIQLIGRAWLLGVVYDGFSYPESIDLA